MKDEHRKYRVEPPIYPVQLRAVDGARFVVRQVSYPSGELVDISGGFYCEWDDVDVSLEEAAQLATAVAWNDETGYYEPHVARQSYTAFEWGASGYGIEFLVELINSVSADLVTLGLGYAIGKMRGRRVRPDDIPMEDAEALTVEARRAVSAVFEENFDGVTVDETMLSSEVSQVALSGQRGRYRATFGRLETGDLFTHVAKLDTKG